MLKTAKHKEMAVAGSKKRQVMPTHTWLGWKLPRAISRPWGGLRAPGPSHAGYSHLAMWNLWRKEYKLRHEFANVVKFLCQTPTGLCSSSQSQGLVGLGRFPLPFLNFQTQTTISALRYWFKNRCSGCQLWLADKGNPNQRDFCAMQKMDLVYLGQFTYSKDAPVNNGHAVASLLALLPCSAHPLYSDLAALPHWNNCSPNPSCLRAQHLAG